MTNSQQTRILLIFVAALIIAALSFGIRQSFGLFMRPLSVDLGWGREILSFALATQNLAVGLAVPFSGALADKWGPGKVIMAGGVLFATGIFLMSQSTTPTGMLLTAGILTGIGVSACGLPLVLSVVARIANDKQRSLWLGLVTAGSTAGQLLLLPVAQYIISTDGWVAAVITLSICAAFIVPLAAFITNSSAQLFDKKENLSLGGALMEARGHYGYWMLTVGFFVCGFQVLFIAMHLPAYLVDKGMDPSIAATSLGVIAFFNMLGAWASGYLGGHFRKKYLLGGLYICRSIIIIIFISLPLSNTSVLLFSAAIGFLWLSTVPLTSGIVAQIFGPRYMATLYGIVYLSHQLGSFSGVWVGGWLFDVYGSYEQVWYLAIALGFVAAALHLPLNDHSPERKAAANA
ncbi:MFS transporter [Pseudomonadota bacterium]